MKLPGVDPVCGVVDDHHPQFAAEVVRGGIKGGSTQAVLKTVKSTVAVCGDTRGDSGAQTGIGAPTGKEKQRGPDDDWWYQEATGQVHHPCLQPCAATRVRNPALAA